ncbi:MAG: hypothetical protein J4F37_13610 [Acidobacteria bacterium]|nr:hypothetical protein [Acidobacteriota bacterium]
MPATLFPRLCVDFPAVQTWLNAEEEAVVMETIRNSFWSDMPEEILRYMAESIRAAAQRLRAG